jgi:hypothetical protein
VWTSLPTLTTQGSATFSLSSKSLLMMVFHWPNASYWYTLLSYFVLFLPAPNNQRKTVSGLFRRFETIIITFHYSRRQWEILKS